MFALAIPIGLVVAMRVFLGSNFLINALGNHIPHIGDDGVGSMGFYLSSPEFLSLDYLGMLAGLVIAAALLTGAVWLRKHRFEM